MMRAKWCPDCEIVWQTRRKTCYGCGHEFADADAFTISKGVAKPKLPPDNRKRCRDGEINCIVECMSEVILGQDEERPA